jgi:hypothetical protein
MFLPNYNCSLSFGISTTDVYRAISDNTASAVSASCMIAEKRGSETQKIYCLIHTVDLAVKHVLGILVRRKKRSSKPM